MRPIFKATWYSAGTPGGIGLIWRVQWVCWAITGPAMRLLGGSRTLRGDGRPGGVAGRRAQAPASPLAAGLYVISLAFAYTISVSSAC